MMVAFLCDTCGQEVPEHNGIMIREHFPEFSHYSKSYNFCSHECVRLWATAGSNEKAGDTTDTELLLHIASHCSYTYKDVRRLYNTVGDVEIVKIMCDVVSHSSSSLRSFECMWEAIKQYLLKVLKTP